ncbi:MAG TPA: hypothetical protein VGN38_05115 [Caulobacteraceae bacterium]|jgi:uncharacterized membrane-anchored protein|nr:hypothetical protein [Caulobacteraceae bacterium]
MNPLTIYLARLFGLGCLLMCGVFVARPKGSLGAITSMMESRGALLVTGIATMTAGLAAVIGHNHWSGGVLTVVVTVLCWATLVKGFAILAAPPEFLAALYRWIGYPASFRVVMGIAALLSLWLTWAAFSAATAP